MLKQSDALIIFAISAAVIGVLVLSSDTATVVIITALAAVFGSLTGVRLRNARSANSGMPVPATAMGTEQYAAGTSAHGAPEPSATGRVQTGRKSRKRRKSAEPPQVDPLMNLVSSVTEGITFKDSHGRYISANAAFAQMLDSSAAQIVGKDDVSIFGHITAKPLLESDDVAAAQGQASTTVEVPLPDGLRMFEITKTSMSSDDDGLEGIVAVWRDVTEPARSRLSREKAMRETIRAFTKSIELRDPYLSDHAQRLARLATAVTDVLALNHDARTTVELAAHLSQIGKLGLDADLLGQPRRFTEEEIKAVQKHVHHTARLLRDLDFGLPVAATLFKIHERLDGTGYPQGLRAEDTPLEARILGACDAFCARIAPRSYRPAIEPQAALDILLQNPHRYDETVVRAMQQVIQSPDSGQILA